MTTNKPVSCGDIIKTITSSQDSIISCSGKASNEVISGYTKEQLWKSFNSTFKLIHGKNLNVTDQFIENIKPLFLYFLGDQEFFKCKNLRADIIEPSFKKGLLIIGGYGVGKTDFLKVFESVFKYTNGLNFKFYSTSELVRRYESLQIPNDKDFFNNDMARKRIFIDDLDAEKLASNYGFTDVIQQVISLRYEKKLRTFASCNYSNDEKNVEQTLNNLGKRYGHRIYDRLFEMFNVVEFKGKSCR